MFAVRLGAPAILRLTKGSLFPTVSTNAAPIGRPRRTSPEEFQLRHGPNFRIVGTLAVLVGLSVLGLTIDEAVGC